MTTTDRGRIQGLLAEGWRLLELGKAREAALVFGRVVLVEPTRAEALQVERSNLYRKMKGYGLLPARKGEAVEPA